MVHGWFMDDPFPVNVYRVSARLVACGSTQIGSVKSDNVRDVYRHHGSEVGTRDKNDE